MASQGHPADGLQHSPSCGLCCTVYSGSEARDSRTEGNSSNPGKQRGLGPTSKDTKLESLKATPTA